MPYSDAYQNYQAPPMTGSLQQSDLEDIRRREEELLNKMNGGPGAAGTALGAGTQALSMLGKAKSATPWGIGGMAVGKLGDVLGKRNPKLGGTVAGLGKGAATGATIGSVVPGIGTVIGGVIGGAIGGLRGFFSGKKKKEQRTQLAKLRQAEEDAVNFEALKQKYMGGGATGSPAWQGWSGYIPRFQQYRPSAGGGAMPPISAAQNYLKTFSPEDQASILKSFGNRDALQEWYENARNAGVTG